MLLPVEQKDSQIDRQQPVEKVSSQHQTAMLRNEVFGKKDHSN
ncbi:hypothetical protein RRSWK_05205 [Rhodopirellula sp. SWK7]|nr:hypothetical protein RRSWK_05205 [Rhodopirellula sp. SWK7]